MSVVVKILSTREMIWNRVGRGKNARMAEGLACACDDVVQASLSGGE